MSTRFSESSVIDRPPEEVWPHVAELEQELRWRAPYVVALEAVDPGPIAVDTRIRGTVKAAGTTDTYLNQVTELDPPRRYAWRGLEVSGSLIGVEGAYVLEPVDSGRTRVTIEIAYEARGLGGRLMMPVWRFAGPRILRRFLRQLDELVTAG